MKTKILVFLAALLLPVGVFAQSELKGTVTDASGPLAGVMILNKDNGKWASTDIDGNWRSAGWPPDRPDRKTQWQRRHRAAS